MTTSRPLHRHRCGPAVAALLVALFALALPAAAQAPPAPVAGTEARRPLLMQGTTSLWQRVLTRPGARLSPAPGGDPLGTELPPLSLLFVYARAPGPGGEWIEIGTAPTGQTLGWIPATLAIDWKQTLVVAFTNPVNRGRALFFRDEEALLSLMEAPDAGAQAGALGRAAETGTLPADGPVAAVEPATWIDPGKSFYLLPILDWADGYFASGLTGLGLKVAATSLQERPDQPETASADDPGAAERLLAGYRAGVVFVVDTTVSMDPYIARTRDTIRQVTETLRHSGWGDRLSFGLIGFRDVMADGSPDGYITRVFANLPENQDERGFIASLASAEASKVSNLDFKEDAFAGVKAALDDIDWSGVAGRFIVLVTDASPRRGNDPFSSTGLDVEQLRLLAQAKGAAVIAIHVETAAGGQADHESAREAYEALTTYPNVGTLYFPVEGGDVRSFGAVVDRVSQTMIRQMESAGQGQVAGAGQDPASGQEERSAAERRIEEAVARTGLVGRAMQLAYIGRTRDARPPRLFSAWVSDRDLANPALKALDVRVLITKNQLSDLQATLRAILEAGEATRIAPNDFFRQMRSAAATMSRRPEAVGREEARRLADLGLIGEYLEGLPYRSRIMDLTEDDWLSWSYGQQRQFLDDLQAKIRLYQQVYDNTDLWIALDGDRTGGEAVYPMPLDALP
ncbi:vWA domain-containing protein [Inquilinus sp. NPDC058860]|uniref:vWA domain-containing protein n=1 Tax=Inquilinus sp. NPDC058860 TaxID=3346652 RepID=UPI0036A1C9E8